MRTLSAASSSAVGYKRAEVSRPKAAVVKKSASAGRAAVATAPIAQVRNSRMAAIVNEVIENLKQDNQEELEIRQKYGLK